jgi:hypothetical protein
VNQLFSRTALLVALAYAAIIGFLLILVWRNSDAEGQVYALLFLGFPWVLALFPLRSNSWALYVLAVLLNIATVYILALAIVRIFSSFRE